MRMFGYYALHSFINQLRKIFKTWVIVFILVCALIGGGVGYFAATMENTVQEQQAEEAVLPEDPAESSPNRIEQQGVDKAQFLELAVGVLLLVLLCYQALSADKNGSKLFLPADVNLLFASPMKPQSVLMFRLATQMGVAVFFAAYMLVQIPNLMNIFGMSLWASVALLADFGFAFALASLIKVELYLLCSRSPAFKANLSRGIYILLALLGAGYLLCLRRSGLPPLAAAAAYLNAPFTRWLPVWGWLKAFPVFAAEGKPGLCLFSALLMVLGAALLLWVISRTKADFYEDAMAKSEETAALLEQAQAQRSGRVGMKRRKKDRADTLRRDGLNRGSGAAMFFRKTMYNRFRFAHFGFLTKTTETYLAAGAAAAIFVSRFFDSSSELVLVLPLAALAFFRALGNPLEQDVKMGYFVLIPENSHAKLFWSLAGSTVCCLLDLLPGLLLGTLLLHADLLAVLAWLPFILSVDLFATVVGSFIDLSVPVNAGSTIKTFLQIMFIYFGLIPDAIILTVGIVTDHMLPAALGATALNFAAAFLFFLLTAVYLEPYGGRHTLRPGECPGDPAQARRVFSRAGLAVFALLFSASALQLLCASLLPVWFPAAAAGENALWLITFLPIYAVGFPLAFLLVRRLPASLPGDSGITTVLSIKALLICFFFMYGGNLLGTILTTLLGKLLHTGAENAIAAYAMSDSLPLKLLFLVLLAPVFEEYLFRKLLIDRLHTYGKATAVFTTAAMFGLFHGNLSQFFYAFGLGLVFGYVYLRTGRFRYTVALHMLINFLGSVLAPALLNGATAAEGMNAAVIAYYAYVVFLLLAAVTGLVLLITSRRSFSFAAAENELPAAERAKAVWLNPGMLLLVLAFLLLTAVSLGLVSLG